MNEYEQLLTKFYTAFKSRDADEMIACYHNDTEFSDPVYPSLDNSLVSAMWRMLCQNAVDLNLEFDGITADESGGSARWIATYTFQDTGRLVEGNEVNAAFKFKDGLIIQHVDDFDLKKWANMALGRTGRILSSLGLLKHLVRKKGKKKLEDYIHNN